jgi:hypothetical protein
MKPQIIANYFRLLGAKSRSSVVERYDTHVFDVEKPLKISCFQLQGFQPLSRVAPQRVQCFLVAWMVNFAAELSSTPGMLKTDEPLEIMNYTLW